MYIRLSENLYLSFEFLNGLMFGFEYSGEYDILLLDFAFFRVMVYFNGLGVDDEE